MKKKDYKLEDYKVKMYGKPVIGKSYSEENAMLFKDKKEEQGKDMKKRQIRLWPLERLYSLYFLSH